METDKSDQWQDRDEVEEVQAQVEGFSVSVKKKVYDKIYGWCKAAKDEVSGLGLVEKQDSQFVVYDAFLPKQECTSASTDLDEDAVAELQYKLDKKNVPGSHLRFWWHTHHNFSCFWSVTDVTTIEKMVGSSMNWILSMVINQKNQYKCRLDLMDPIRLALDDITAGTIYPKSRVKKDKYEKEVASAVRQKVHQYQVGYGHHRNGHYPHERHHGGSTRYMGEGYWYQGRFIRFGSKEETMHDKELAEATANDHNAVGVGYPHWSNELQQLVRSEQQEELLLERKRKAEEQDPPISTVVDYVGEGYVIKDGNMYSFEDADELGLAYGKEQLELIGGEPSNN